MKSKMLSLSSMQRVHSGCPKVFTNGLLAGRGFLAKMLSKMACKRVRKFTIFDQLLDIIEVCIHAGLESLLGVSNIDRITYLRYDLVHYTAPPALAIVGTKTIHLGVFITIAISVLKVFGIDSFS